MNKIFCLVSFVAGAAAGSLITWKLVEQKYRNISDAEIESVKKAFAEEREIFAEEKETEIKANVAKEKPDIMKYANVLNKEGYTNYRKQDESTDKDEHDPFVIRPEHFGEYEEFERISLKYYKEDGILTDDNDEMVEDPAIAIPEDGLDIHFGEYEDDSVYTRNEALKTDFEILLVLGAYDDILAEKPYLNSARLTDE